VRKGVRRVRETERGGRKEQRIRTSDCERNRDTARARARNTSREARNRARAQAPESKRGGAREGLKGRGQRQSGRKSEKAR